MSRTDMTRRVLLRGIGVLGLAAVATPGVASVSPPLDPRQARVAADIVRGTVSNVRGAARLGAAYLRTAPDEADLTRLLDALTAHNPDLAHPGERDMPGDAGSTLRRQIVMDFEQDAVVDVDGWILSRTEVRLAALAHMVRGLIAIA